MNESKIIIYSDGASHGNPGPGAFAVILRYKNMIKTIVKGFKKTTNNRMELLGIIEGLKAIKNRNIPIEVYSDSRYVINTINKSWLQNWIKIDFKGKKNKDLWLEFFDVYQKLKVSFFWIKGHNNDEYNEKCDQLTQQCILNDELFEDTEYMKTI